MKKRKKLDMNIIVQRETKKRKKIEKAIKKLELKGRQLKPIDEIEGDRSFIKTLEWADWSSCFYLCALGV